MVVFNFSNNVIAGSDYQCKEGDSQCTFVLLSELKIDNTSAVNNEKTTLITTINDKRAHTAFSPYSTFKIANTLIGLETGIIRNSAQKLKYDKSKYLAEPWWPPVWKLPEYNLTSAFKYSMVPVYRQLAINIGGQEMQKYVNKFTYGNRDISSQLDKFWLNGSLKISAIEQVKFLQKVYKNHLALKENSLTTLKEVMLVEANDEYKLYAKTGAGKINDKTMLGWYVGFVENKRGVHYFAFNVNRQKYTELKAVRVNTARAQLKSAGVI
jgi:beta-lactamase class D